MFHATDAGLPDRPEPADWLRSPHDSPPGGRLATALRWLRWPVLVVWLLAAVALFSAAHSLSSVANSTPEVNLQSSAPSTRVLVLQQAAQHGQPNNDTAIVVFARAAGLSQANLAAVNSARAAVARLAGHVAGLHAPGTAQRSADGRAVVFTAVVTSSASDETTTDVAAVQAIRGAVSGPASRAGDGLQVAVTGSAAVTADSQITSSSNTLLLTALLVVAVVLVLIYRRPLLWLLPMVSDLVAITAARAAAHGLLNAGLTVSTLTNAILTVLILGAATDYALLLIARYREELRRHAAAADAMAVALRRTFPTLLTASGTAICGMLCLLAADSAALHGLGPVAAAGLALALLVQVTFLPALLLAFGRAAFWPGIPRPAGQPPASQLSASQPGRATGREGSRLWTAIGTRVARHPARVAMASVVLLGAACVGLIALRTDNNPVATVPGHPGSVTGAHLLAQHFPGADHDPLTVLAPLGEAAAASATARSTPGVSAVARAAPTGDYATYTVTLSDPNYSAGAYATIANLRGTLDRVAPGSLVGGDQAIQYDIIQAGHRDELVLIPLVLAVIFVVIAGLLRALVAPLVLVAASALSFGASFGLAALLWRFGLGYPGIEAQLPMYVFIFLVALGVDYSVFLSARIREEAGHLGMVKGTLRGLGVTGGVITAAGFVLAATFADLSLLPYIPVIEVGTAVAIGVLLDTLFVRTVVVPASLLTVGDRVWWPTRVRQQPAGA